MTDLLWKFCHHGDAEARDEAHQTILARGEAILPELIEAVAEELDRVSHTLPSYEDDGSRYPSKDPLVRLVEHLVIFEHPASLFPLTWVAAWTSEAVFQKPFLRIYATLEARATPVDIAAFVEALRRLRELSGTKAQQLLIASALVRMAERDPKPELRAALPLLRPTLRTPWEFIELRKRLKVLLGEDNLPIPAMETQTTENLPRPSEENA